MVPIQRPGQSRQDYRTPPIFLRAVKRRFHLTTFTFDFAADATNATAPTWWSASDNSLTQSVADWTARCQGGYGWLNPPFGDIRPWTHHCQETGAAGGRLLFLAPASVGSNWFRDSVDGHARVLFLNGRLAFMPDKPTWLYPKDCMLCVYGVDAGYEVWTWRNDAM